MGKFHFTSSKARYFTMCNSTLFHVLRKQNISLHAFVTTNAVLVKKKGRGIFAILRPFPVGRYFDFYTALSQIPPKAPFLYSSFGKPFGIYVGTIPQSSARTSASSFAMDKRSASTCYRRSPLSEGALQSESLDVNFVQNRRRATEGRPYGGGCA